MSWDGAGGSAGWPAPLASRSARVLPAAPTEPPGAPAALPPTVGGAPGGVPMEPWMLTGDGAPAPGKSARPQPQACPPAKSAEPTAKAGSPATAPAGDGLDHKHSRPRTGPGPGLGAAPSAAGPGPQDQAAADARALNAVLATHARRVRSEDDLLRLLDLAARVTPARPTPGLARPVLEGLADSLGRAIARLPSPPARWIRAREVNTLIEALGNIECIRTEPVEAADVACVAGILGALLPRIQPTQRAEMAANALTIIGLAMGDRSPLTAPLAARLHDLLGGAGMSDHDYLTLLGTAKSIGRHRMPFLVQTGQDQDPTLLKQVAFDRQTAGRVLCSILEAVQAGAAAGATAPVRPGVAGGIEALERVRHRVIDAASWLLTSGPIDRVSVLLVHQMLAEGRDWPGMDLVAELVEQPLSARHAAILEELSDPAGRDGATRPGGPAAPGRHRADPRRAREAAALAEQLRETLDLLKRYRDGKDGKSRPPAK